jgi:hypothetical protein
MSPSVTFDNLPSRPDVSPDEGPFQERRRTESDPHEIVRERRQFSDDRSGLSPAAEELARAVDGYKLSHRRRFITFEELLGVVRQLGYHK